jgi:hypothetical protein
MLITLDEARERIDPLRGILVEGHEATAKKWETLVTEQPDLARVLDATTRANFLHDHLCAEISRRVGGIPNVEATDALDFFALRIGTEILLRHKFVGQGAPSNVKTKQQKRLARQEFDEATMYALTGDKAFKPPTLLTCGYTLDGVEIDRIEIRMDCVGKLPWSFDIYGGEAVAEPLILQGMADESKPAAVKSARKKATEKGDERAAGA